MGIFKVFSSDSKSFPDSSVSKESTCNAGDPQFDSRVGKICWRRDRIPTPVVLGFPGGSAGKESTCNAGDLSSIPELGRCPGKGRGYSLQYSGLENSMGCIVCGVAKSQTWLSDFHFLVILISSQHWEPLSKSSWLFHAQFLERKKKKKISFKRTHYARISN